MIHEEYHFIGVMIPLFHKITKIYRLNKISDENKMVQSVTSCTLSLRYQFFENIGSLPAGSKREKQGDYEDHEQTEQQLQRCTDLHIIHERILSGRHDKRIGWSGKWRHETK